MSQEPTAVAGGRDLLHFDFRGSRRPPPHTHTPRTLVRAPSQGPTQNVTPGPKSRIERGKLLGFSTLLKPVPSGRGTWRSRTPFKIRAVDCPGITAPLRGTPGDNSASTCFLGVMCFSRLPSARYEMAILLALSSEITKNTKNTKSEYPQGPGVWGWELVYGKP